ncbi:MAG TPA: DUF2628 domain-containing protein [Pseudolabrys sp.]|nr:DUF2628 domain-containing protein [Pseudolabrys sp.]
MPTYTVHAPRPGTRDELDAAERFVFVRDGFYFWAFLLAPLWLLVHGLWLALLIYIIFHTAIETGLALAGISANVQILVGVLIALIIGLEASSIRRWTLARRGWTTVGFVVGDDDETAERRFFGEWCKDAQRVARKSGSSEQDYSHSTRVGPPSGSDVIGLFPEAGGQR